MPLEGAERTRFWRDPRFKELQGAAVWWSPVYFNGREPFMAIAVAHSGRAAGSTVAEVEAACTSSACAQ